jgi:hypothetical protein
MGTTLPPDAILDTLDKYPDLLFDIGQMLAVTAGPWERQTDARTQDEWVRRSAIPGPDGRLYVARVWMDEDLSSMHGLVVWRWGTWIWDDANGTAFNTVEFQPADSAEQARELADQALTEKGWRLA